VRVGAYGASLDHRTGDTAGREEVVAIPVAMAEMITRFFGSAAHPDYSGMRDVFARDPYRPLRELLSRRWDVFDRSDPNYDLGFVYVLTDHPDRLTVRLSAVGPYAAIVDGNWRFVCDGDVADLIIQAGFRLLDRVQLEEPVLVWEPEATGSVYEFLFEFDQDPPWVHASHPG
jgi:hypothetical protein